jgi:NADP-dependent 3-hydroxy acid dehydrogenase YdfG
VSDETAVPGDLFSVRDKVAVVTGGTSGIGLISRAASYRPARAFVTSRKADACVRVQDELSQLGWCRAIRADVGDTGAVAALVATVVEQGPAVDALINNAGTTWGRHAGGVPG